MRPTQSTSRAHDARSGRMAIRSPMASNSSTAGTKKRMVQLEHIGYSSLQDIAYERIRDALRKGAFQPGEGLRTRTLAKALGVSTTPVREALARLVAQKVLSVDPVNGTPYVPVITREQLMEIFELREVLEQLAARHAAENITEEELRRLDELRARMKKASS